jgi:hypothetical protein
LLYLRISQYKVQLDALPVQYLDPTVSTLKFYLVRLLRSRTVRFDSLLLILERDWTVRSVESKMTVSLDLWALGFAF